MDSVNDIEPSSKRGHHRYPLRSRSKSPTIPTIPDSSTVVPLKPKVKPIRSKNKLDKNLVKQTARFRKLQAKIDANKVDQPYEPANVNKNKNKKNRQIINLDDEVMEEDVFVDDVEDESERSEDEGEDEMKDFIVKDDISEGSDSDYELEENYWLHDTRKIRHVIIDKLAKSTGIAPDILKPNVDKTFKKLGTMLVDEYLGVMPADQRWKLTLSKAEIAELEPILKKIRQTQENETPTLNKILKATIPYNDKVKCVELYDALQNIEPFTEKYIEFKAKLVNMIGVQSNYDEETLAHLNKQEELVRASSTHEASLKTRILTLDVPMALKKQLYDKCLQLDILEPGTTYASIKETLDWWVSLPHGKMAPLPFDPATCTNQDVINYSLKILRSFDEELYGMPLIKVRFVEILNNHITSEGRCGGQLALCGPPGVGKTAVGKAIAKATGRHFEKISAGGMKDATMLKGSDGVWVGSGPNILLHILRRAKTNDPIIMIDEIEKASVEFQQALLDIADRNQSKESRDAFLHEYSHDLSNIMFIYCINSETPLIGPLRDRMDVFTLTAYSPREKAIIVDRYMLPRYLSQVGMAPDSVVFTERSSEYLVALTSSNLDTDHGMRTLEKEIESLVSRINLLRMTTLPDGTTGNLKLPYRIKRLKFPLTLTSEIIDELYSNRKQKSSPLSYFN